MSTAAMACRVCKAEMALHPIDPVCGEEGALKVTLIRLPAMVCPNTHRRFAVSQFPILLLERLSGNDIDTLPAGTKSGLLFKRCPCGACGAPLAGAGREESFDFDVKLESLPPFRVQLATTLYSCTSCGKAQVRSRDDVRKPLPAPWRVPSRRRASTRNNLGAES